MSYPQLTNSLEGEEYFKLGFGDVRNWIRAAGERRDSDQWASAAVADHAQCKF